jgi:uncharacterized phage protein (TIGR01671 family)
MMGCHFKILVMKREIKFRGKRNSNEEWVYGLPSYGSGGAVGRITGWTEPGDDSIGAYFDVEVIPESIGEFTGVKDRNRKEIYEGDIIRMDNMLFTITYLNDSFLGKAHGNHFRYKIKEHYSFYPYSDVEVIGNIYDNPALL